MKGKVAIILSLLLLIILSIVFVSLKEKNQTKTVKVEENGLAIRMTVLLKNKTLEIETTIKNISSETKVLTFPTPCQRGLYFRTSNDFETYYKSENTSCITVIDTIELSPDEELKSNFQYEKVKEHRFKNIDIWPGIKQKEVVIKM